jgi:hypothetical protein
MAEGGAQNKIHANPSHCTDFSILGNPSTADDNGQMQPAK